MGMGIFATRHSKTARPTTGKQLRALAAQRRKAQMDFWFGEAEQHFYNAQMAEQHMYDDRKTFRLAAQYIRDEDAKAEDCWNAAMAWQNASDAEVNSRYDEELAKPIAPRRRSLADIINLVR